MRSLRHQWKKTAGMLFKLVEKLSCRTQLEGGMPLWVLIGLGLERSGKTEVSEFLLVFHSCLSATEQTNEV